MSDFITVPASEQASQAVTENGPLGLIGKSASSPSQSEETPFERRIARWYLQSVARELLPNEGVALCMRALVPGSASVPVVHSRSKKRASYRNLRTCKSVWADPFCSSWITEKRRVELSAALKSSSYTLLLLTYTMRHGYSQALRPLRDGLLKAHRSIRSGEWFQNFKAAFSWLGSIRSLEVTHGNNGWHPHLHELVVLQRPLGGSLGIFRDKLRVRWLTQLERVGQGGSFDYALDVREGFGAVSNYVAKFGRLPSWSLEHELVKGPVKMGKSGSRTPFQLLLDYAMGDENAGELFREYVAATKGCKQLVWSPGLRELLGLGGEVADEGLCEDEPAGDEVVLATLTFSDWQKVLANDARAELLEVAGQGDKRVLAQWLIGLGVYVYPDEDVQ